MPGAPCVRKNQRVPSLEGPGNPLYRHRYPCRQRHCRPWSPGPRLDATSDRPRAHAWLCRQYALFPEDDASPNDFPSAQPTTVLVCGSIPSPPWRWCCFDKLYVGTIGSGSIVRKSLILIIALARTIPSPLKLAEARRRLDDHLRGDLGPCAASLACI